MDPEQNHADALDKIKARWLGPELHRAEWWADQAGRDVPWLIAEVERLRCGVPATLALYGANQEPLLMQHLIVKPGSGFEWVASGEDQYLLQRARRFRLHAGTPRSTHDRPV